MNADIEGIEFDWFALDESGSLAMFATAGEGFVPAVVAENHHEHGALSEAIASSNWGSEKVWDDYSDLGLYVYDWQLPGGPYVRVRTPARPMNGEMQRKLLAMSSLPRLELEFREAETVASLSGN